MLYQRPVVFLIIIGGIPLAQCQKYWNIYGRFCNSLPTFRIFSIQLIIEVLQNDEFASNSPPPLLPYHCRTPLGWLRMGQIFVALLTVICTSIAFEFWHQGYQFFWILLTAGLVLVVTTSVTILYCTGMPETQPKLPWEPTMLVANVIFTVFYLGSFAMGAWAASLHKRHRFPQGIAGPHDSKASSNLGSSCGLLRLISKVYGLYIGF